MWYGEMCVHLYDLPDVLAAKATATTEATTTAAATKTKEGARQKSIDRAPSFVFLLPLLLFMLLLLLLLLLSVHQVDHKDEHIFPQTT